MNFLNWLRVLFLGIIEGVTEWLPISSTGHLILFDTFWKGDASVFTESFTEVFNVVIQLGAILAGVTLFFYKLNPFSPVKSAQQKKNTWILWSKILVAVIPAAVFGFLFDDWMDEHLYNGIVVAIMLIVYGIAFLVVENVFGKRDAKIVKLSELGYGTALLIGLFQVLSLVPGTSRSGVTILGALILGCSRYIAAEFTFFLAIPVMFGASLLKLVKYFLHGMAFTGVQWAVLLTAMAMAYLVSLAVIRFLLRFIKRNDFKPFGIYRIVLGVLVLVLVVLIHGA